jgi:hypothetical protein
MISIIPGLFNDQMTIYKEFPGIEKETAKMNDFPGFQGLVRTQGIQKHICLIHLKLLLRQKYFLIEIIRIDILNPEILLLQETKWEVMF